MIMADNGSSMYISGAPDDRSSNDDLHALGGVAAGDFEVVEMNPIYTSFNVPSGPAPTISSFTASPSTVGAGSTVTLTWAATVASYSVYHRASAPYTTYTLATTNQFGRTT